MPFTVRNSLVAAAMCALVVAPHALAQQDGVVLNRIDHLENEVVANMQEIDNIEKELGLGPYSDDYGPLGSTNMMVGLDDDDDSSQDDGYSTTIGALRASGSVCKAGIPYASDPAFKHFGDVPTLPWFENYCTDGPALGWDDADTITTCPDQTKNWYDDEQGRFNSLCKGLLPRYNWIIGVDGGSPTVAGGRKEAKINLQVGLSLLLSHSLSLFLCL